MIGLACGNGYYLGAVITSIFVFIFILVLKPIESKINNKKRSIILTVDSNKVVMATIVKIFDEEHVAIENISMDYYERNDKQILKLKIIIEHTLSQDKVNPITIVSK
jgi:uncharacterized membrane protein YhiD involved in acid resistance